MYTGNNSEISKRKQRFIDSTAADVVYVSSGGKRLPGQHLALALALKSMTGSMTVTSLINRFGLESTITQTSTIVPDTIMKNADTSIALAWDNFDINLETLSVANSLHHTYGICCQNVQEIKINTPRDSPRSIAVKRQIKDISKYSPVSDDCLEPYYKKKSLISNFLRILCFVFMRI